jgi:PKD repeat protein
MIAKPIAAILAAAILVSASGTVGSFYFVGAQDQDQVTTGQAEITLSNIEASPGSVVDVNGSNFGADSQVSIYFMSAKQANFANGSAFVLQGISANQSTTADQEGDGNFFDEDEDALNALEVLLELSNTQGSNNTTTINTPNTSEGNLLVALEGGGTPNNGTMSLECDDEILAEGGINGTIVTFAVPPGTYDGCSISISDGNITDTGEIGNLMVVSDSKEDYQNSAVTSVTADEQGAFEASIRVPNIEEGEYAILAVGDDRMASVSRLSVTSAQPATETEATFANATADIINETITQTPEEEELAEEESTELLTAEIISNGTEGFAPATFEFQANLTGGTEPYTYIWNFSDGSEGSDEQTVLHTFEEAGTYNVTLTATDTDNQNASDSIEISVEEPAEEGGEAATTAIQNQTQNNQTDTREEGTVQLDETSAQPGSPLAISGEGFQPDTPIQIFINNVQITNVITNVEGSFNTVVIVPTTVAAGSAQVVVRTKQTSIAENVNIIESDGRSEGPSTLRLTAVSATDNGRALNNAPVTIFDASSGQVIESGKTPMDIELQEGTYSIFYSDFERFEFESAEPGRWINTPDGGVGLITIREGRNTTVTAIYSERPAPPPPPSETENSLTLRAQDTQGNLIQNMFVTVYNVDATEKIEQGFTELRVDDLRPGTYPIFFANFDDLVFISASPGTWIQTPFGGVGLVTIPDDGEDHDLVVTAVYNRTTVVEEQFNIQAPLDLEGHIFSITSNQTRPEGPFVMSGSFALRVSDEEPVSATLSAYIMSAREDSNENVDLESQRSRDHDTFQIVDLKPQVARPIGLNSYIVSGTADLLLNGDMYSNDERIVVIVRGGEELTPTNIEIDFRGDQRYSAANRLETLYGVVSSGFE